MLSKITKFVLITGVWTFPFLTDNSLYFPFISLKIYLLRFFILLSFGLWGFLMLKPESKINFKNPIIIATLIFFAGMIITGALGVDPLNSFFSGMERSEGIFMFGVWIAYLLMTISLFKKESDWENILKIFVSSAAILSVYSWLSYFGIYDPDKIGNLMHAGFGNKSYFAGYLLFAIGFSLLLKKWWKLPAAIFIITIIFNQTRGAYLGLIAGLIIFSFMARKERYGKYLLSVLAIIVILLGNAFLLRNTNFVRGIEPLSHFTDIADGSSVASVDNRIETGKIAMRAFWDKPVLGWGFENYPTAFNKFYNWRLAIGEPWYDRVHNQLLEILVSGGIFLGTLYLAWISVIFSEIKGNKILMATYAAFLVQGLFLFDNVFTTAGLFTLLGYGYYQSGVRKMNCIDLDNKVCELEKREINFNNL